MQAAASERADMEADLRRALQEEAVHACITSRSWTKLAR